MSQADVLKWFKDKRESGCNDWFCMSSVYRGMRASKDLTKCACIRRAIVILKDDGFLDEQRPQFWHRYFRLNDKYLDNFDAMLK